VLDERITISHDPSDPELGTVPDPYVAPITWIEHGVLKTLEYQRWDTLLQLNENSPTKARGSYRMSGGSTTLEEMIASTQRGLIVTRFSSVSMIDNSSVLATGLTRDGVWLVENGKISKAVRNFRFTESPLFAFNNIEQLGVPVPVYQPFAHPDLVIFSPRYAVQQVIVPPMKVNDFSFTSTIDAV
jgi:predicted Zn-dependent protease